MLTKASSKPYIDLSAELNDELDWKAGTLRTLVHHLDITALAYEPVSGILAIGALARITSIEMTRIERVHRNKQGLRRPIWRSVSGSGASPGAVRATTDTKPALRSLAIQACLRRSVSH